MPGMRSLRNRLAVIFALIIVGAIGTIYLSVTPRLEESLTSQRQDQVQTTATQYLPDISICAGGEAGGLAGGADQYGHRRTGSGRATMRCGHSRSASAPRSW